MYTKEVHIYKTDFEAHVEIEPGHEAPSAQDLKVWLSQAYKTQLLNADYPPPLGVRHVDVCVVLGELRCAKTSHRTLLWTAPDAATAERHGWELYFWDDDTKCHIRHLEDPDDVAKEEGFAPYRGPRFKNEDEAVEYVTMAAKFGDETAQLALDLVAACQAVKDAARAVAAPELWYPWDAALAWRQGWDLLRQDKDWAVHRLKEIDELAETENFAPYRGPRFQSDPEALAFVRQVAGYGDEVCRKALALMGEAERRATADKSTRELEHFHANEEDD